MSFKQRTKTLFARYPWMGPMLVRLYRHTQPMFSAGVTGVLLNDEGQVLMVEHVFHTQHAWGLPGGWMGRGEGPERTIEREFHEETGLVVRAALPLAITQGDYWRNHLDFAYLMEPIGEQAPIQLCYELTNFGWFALDDHPPIKPFHEKALQALKSRSRV